MLTLKTKIKTADTLAEKIALVQSLLQQKHLKKHQIELNIVQVVMSMPDDQIEAYLAGKSNSEATTPVKVLTFNTQAELKAHIINELRNKVDPRALAKKYPVPLNTIYLWKRNELNYTPAIKVERKMAEIKNSKPLRTEYLCELRHYFVTNLAVERACCPYCQSKNLILAQNAQVKVGKA